MTPPRELRRLACEQLAAYPGVEMRELHAEAAFEINRPLARRDFDRRGATPQAAPGSDATAEEEDRVAGP